MQPSAITFDAAGTLFTVAEPVGTTYSRFGLDFDWEMPSTAVNQGFREAWRSAPPLHPHPKPLSDPDLAEERWWQKLVSETLKIAGFAEFASSSRFPDYFERLFDYYAHGDAWSLYPETRSVLAKLTDRKIPLGVVSNFDRRLHAVLSDLNLSPFFDSVLLSGEIGFAKPSPEPFRLAAEQFGIPPAKLLHLGDDDSLDGVGARDAGCCFALIDRPDIDLDQALLLSGTRF